MASNCCCHFGAGPRYVPANRDFIPVIDLKPGDLLHSLAEGDTENTSSEVESLELYLPRGKTYNLTVDVGHTFYVGELKTWVHNTGPCDLPPDYFGGGAKGGAKTPKTVEEISTPHRHLSFRRAGSADRGEMVVKFTFRMVLILPKGSTLGSCHLAHQLFQDMSMDTGAGRIPASNQ
ncbi:hypothetical protein [Pseudomonas sp. KNUC1026]|uniref:hypothetical protein n=1 Tax=Pseudomonas sp. KNUC1026 TaxID=2893890 RepID=UPI001F20EC5E|nr:hypothetical protein [Pseudomonas sp. KNUC1026]UFH49557.1 hypothetical protein LN139_22605 [Pseudomonas sp. KNUC1026]